MAIILNGLIGFHLYGSRHLYIYPGIMIIHIIIMFMLNSILK